MTWLIDRAISARKLDVGTWGNINEVDRIGYLRTNHTKSITFFEHLQSAKDCNNAKALINRCTELNEICFLSTSEQLIQHLFTFNNETDFLIKLTSITIKLQDSYEEFTNCLVEKCSFLITLNIMNYISNYSVAAGYCQLIAKNNRLENIILDSINLSTGGSSGEDKNILKCITNHCSKLKVLEMINCELGGCNLRLFVDLIQKCSALERVNYCDPYSPEIFKFNTGIISSKKRSVVIRTGNLLELNDFFENVGNFEEIELMGVRQLSEKTISWIKVNNPHLSVLNVSN